MLQQLITDNIDLWTSAETSRSTAGRGSNGKTELTGIKKLRELILELAVRGLLVPQDPSDEPASVLLEKIATEKEALIKAGKIRKQKAFPKISSEERPYLLPKGWIFIRNGEFLSLKKGKKPKQLSEHDIGIAYLDIEALDRGNTLRYTDDSTCPQATTSDILVVCDGSRSGLVLNGQNGVVGSTLAIIETPDWLQPYVKLIFQHGFRRWNTSMKGAAIPHLDTKNLVVELTGIPPLAEQHRIVAKVDELMALCDQLEQQQLEHSHTHHTLVTTLLDSLCQAADNAQFQSIWSQLAANFDTLFTTEASIDQLKQTLLQLAVMGKLVPQDPNDEPASVLLEKIAAEKAALIKAGKIKKQKPLPEIADDEKPFNLPEGWEWARLIDCYDVRDGTHDSPKYTAEGYPLVTSKNLSSGKLDFSDIKFISETDHKKIIERSRVDAGDILFAMIGSIGNPAIVDTEREFSIKNVALFKYYKKSLSAPHFLLKFLMFAENVFKEQSSGAVQSFVSLGKVRSFPLALPPLPEQHRIVAKVDELMALCDQLKAGLNQAQTTQQQLAHTIVQQAVA